MRGRGKPETKRSIKQAEIKAAAKAIVDAAPEDFKSDKKILVHYNEGIYDAKRGYKPTWFDEELTEWACRERRAYRAGYRTIKENA